MEFEKLRSATYTAHFGVKLKPETKAKLVRLRRSKEIDTSTEIRKLIEKFVEDAEKV